MSPIEIVKMYLTESVYPKLLSILSQDDYISVIGGSYSFGMEDEYSDIDIFLIWDIEPKIWANSLKNILCVPHSEGCANFQIVPINVYHKKNMVYSSIFTCDIDLLKQASVYDLFNISNYIALNDTQNRITNVQNIIRSFDDNYWKTQCSLMASSIIDVLESFYDSSKRNDEFTIIMYYAMAIQKLMELYILSNKQFYPQPKWLWSSIKNINIDMYNKYYKPNLKDLNKENMVCFIKNFAEDVSKNLLLNDLVKPYIADGIINP